MQRRPRRKDEGAYEDKQEYGGDGDNVYPYDTVRASAPTRRAPRGLAIELCEVRLVIDTMFCFPGGACLRRLPRSVGGS